GTWPVFSTDPTASGFSATPPNGNGRLILSMTGTLTNNGTITMAGKGFAGGYAASAGYSHNGYNQGGAGKYSAGGASYGTTGGGTSGSTTYGASDFWTKLYLGAGGAGYYGAWNAIESGGYGGGAISISAGAISNAGTITAAGTKPGANGGGGSGGTVYLNATGDLSNTGTITTAGGTNGASTNTGGQGRVKLSGSSVTVGTCTGQGPSGSSCAQ
ncbi:hypothetical protein EBT16_06320, partial [bacterium]|nr:hypothetical protein [bacterium]